MSLGMPGREAHTILPLKLEMVSDLQDIIRLHAGIKPRFDLQLAMGY